LEAVSDQRQFQIVKFQIVCFKDILDSCHSNRILSWIKIIFKKKITIYNVLVDDFKGLETNWEWKANERGMTNRISHKPQQYVTTIKKEIGNCTFTKQNNNNKLDKNHMWRQLKSSVITYNWKDTWILLFWIRLTKKW
jgi:hypothetical protein